MIKKYQVFVSSTFNDLKDERTKVMTTLMEMDCIPAGMELFPASDEDQFEFIKKIIDECDYYILIIGGRYGSLTEDGISYTEKEYDYALEIGLKIIAFIHENPDELPSEKNEDDSELKQRLTFFRDKVTTGRLVKYWSNASEISGLVALSLIKTIKSYPALGWVRASKESQEDLLREINDLRKENEELKKKLDNKKDYQSSPISLASLEEQIIIKGLSIRSQRLGGISSWEKLLSWKTIFAIVSPFILNNPNEESIRMIFNREFCSLVGTTGKLNEQDFQTIKIQFMALGLIDVQYLKTTTGGFSWFWNLTNSGKKLLMELRTIQSKTI